MRKIIRVIMSLLIAAIVLSAASIGGTVRDSLRYQDPQEQDEPGENYDPPRDISSPFDSFTGGVLTLEMDYEAQSSGNNVYVTILSNLPDEYQLITELTNVESVRRELGYDSISPTALSPEQFAEIEERTYSVTERGFMRNGTCRLFFPTPPTGQLDIRVTSPVTGQQSLAIRELLGPHGENLQGPYVVFLEELNDKSINYTASFYFE